MTWLQKIVILFFVSITAGIMPALATAYANHLFDPGACWPDIYGVYLLIPVGLICGTVSWLTVCWMDKKLNVCGHACEE